MHSNSLKCSAQWTCPGITVGKWKNVLWAFMFWENWPGNALLTHMSCWYLPLTCSLRLMFACCVGSSLYYDEDGDLAHEFYEETVVTKNGRKKSKLKRIQKNLIPQVSDLHALTPLMCSDRCFWMIHHSEYFIFSGNCEARPSLYSCRFPHRPLWGVKSSTCLMY